METKGSKLAADRRAVQTSKHVVPSRHQRATGPVAKHLNPPPGSTAPGVITISF